MSDTNDGLTILDTPGQVFDVVVDTLSRVGIELSPFVSQLFMLAITFTLFFWLARKNWPINKTTKINALISTIALGLISIAIISHWACLYFNPLPDHVAGKVKGTGLNAMTVELTGSHGDSIHLGNGAVDQNSGDFVLRYQAPFGDRPREFIVVKAGCEKETFPINQNKLRSRAEFILNFECRRVPQ